MTTIDLFEQNEDIMDITGIDLFEQNVGKAYVIDPHPPLRGERAIVSECSECMHSWCSKCIHSRCMYFVPAERSPLGYKRARFCQV